MVLLRPIRETPFTFEEPIQNALRRYGRSPADTASSACKDFAMPLMCGPRFVINTCYDSGADEETPKHPPDPRPSKCRYITMLSRNTFLQMTSCNVDALVYGMMALYTLLHRLQSNQVTVSSGCLGLFAPTANGMVTPHGGSQILGIRKGDRVMLPMLACFKKRQTIQCEPRMAVKL